MDKRAKLEERQRRTEVMAKKEEQDLKKEIEKQQVQFVWTLFFS